MDRFKSSEEAERQAGYSLEHCRGALREKENTQALLERQLREEKRYTELRHDEIRELRARLANPKQESCSPQPIVESRVAGVYHAVRQD